MASVEKRREKSTSLMCRAKEKKVHCRANAASPGRCRGGGWKKNRQQCVWCGWRVSGWVWADLGGAALRLTPRHDRCVRRITVLPTDRSAWQTSPRAAGP